MLSRRQPDTMRERRARALSIEAELDVLADGIDHVDGRLSEVLMLLRVATVVVLGLGSSELFDALRRAL
jgi:hypothetical protein